MSKIGDWLRNLDPQDVIDQTELWDQVVTQSKTLDRVRNLLDERADEADANGEEWTGSWTFFDASTWANAGVQGILDAGWGRDGDRWSLYLDLNLAWRVLRADGASTMDQLRDKQLHLVLGLLEVAVQHLASEAAWHGELEEDPDADAG